MRPWRLTGYHVKYEFHDYLFMHSFIYFSDSRTCTDQTRQLILVYNGSNDAKSSKVCLLDRTL